MRWWLWLVVLLTLSLAINLAFACGVPLAAFAAVAAITLPRRQAIGLMLAVWLLNEVAAAVLLHQLTPAALPWIPVLGALALLCTLAAGGRPIVAFLKAFAVYETGLFLAATLLGGLAVFTPTSIVRVFAQNAVAFAALMLAAQLRRPAPSAALAA